MPFRILHEGNSNLDLLLLFPTLVRVAENGEGSALPLVDENTLAYAHMGYTFHGFRQHNSRGEGAMTENDPYAFEGNVRHKVKNNRFHQAMPNWKLPVHPLLKTKRFLVF